MKKLYHLVILMICAGLTSCDEGVYEQQYVTVIEEVPVPLNEPFNVIDTEQEATDAMLDYVGLSLNEADQLALVRNDLLRVIFADGEALALTEDFIPGRINLWLRQGSVTFIEIEGFSFYLPPCNCLISENDAQGLLEQYLGLGEGEARFLAWTQQRAFRVVGRDGQFFPITLDFINGRVNAQIDGGLVSSAEIEVDQLR